MDLDYTLSGIILNGLTAFKEARSKAPFDAIPSIYLNQFDVCLYEEDEDSLAMQKCRDQWVADLDEVIWRFGEEGMNATPDCVECYDDILAHQKRRDDALKTFIKIFDSLWF